MRPECSKCGREMIVGSHWRNHGWWWKCRCGKYGHKATEDERAEYDEWVRGYPEREERVPGAYEHGAWFGTKDSPPK